MQTFYAIRIDDEIASALGNEFSVFRIEDDGVMPRVIYLASFASRSDAEAFVRTWNGSRVNA